MISKSEVPMTDEQRGIYRKYKVERTDGSSAPGGKHADCAYFVLDLEHDEFARAALEAYAEACRKTHPDLAADIRHMLAARPCGCRSVGECSHIFSPKTMNEAAARLININEELDAKQ
jgi:hypothetical protein